MNNPAKADEILETAPFLIKNAEKEEIPLDVLSDKAYTFKGFQFYTIDLKNTPEIKLEPILKQCEEIEKQCWVAQENFPEYAKMRDLLTYILKDGKIIAFQIASYWILGNDFIFDLDETMVTKEYRGNSLALALSAVSCRTFYLRIMKMKNIKKMTFISLTPNLRLVNLLDKLRFAIRFLDTTFNPSRNLMKVHDYVLEKKGASLVDKDYPFFLKSIFPGSLKPADHGHRASKRIQKILPPGLDFHSRGDAFLFVSSFGKIRLWPVHVLLLFKALGSRIIIDRKLGLLSRKKFDHVNKYLTLDKNLHIVPK